ncbi:MAG: PilZ domain-containing protein [Lachnospiraceae bacterium]|nr:PilZ domain-containing protein [Lachnospiraceae bacterium]
MGEEKRRARRVPVFIELEVSSVFKQDNERVTLEDTPIELTDISKMGIGFVTKGKLPIGYYFNAKINLGSSPSSLYCVVKIVREQKIDDTTTKYGCEFVGFPSVLNYIIDEYQKDFPEE